MSGVYINMEMPKNHNHVTITIWPNRTASYALYDRGESLVDFRNVEVVPVPEHGDLIDRNGTIKALWKALFEYEDRMEKQFVESSELDVADWILHRIFVQNMSDIDRQTILQMPTIIPAEEEV